MLSMLAAAAATCPSSLPTFNLSTLSLPIPLPKHSRSASSTGFHSTKATPLRNSRAPVVRVATASADGAVDGSDLDARTGDVGDQDEKEKLGVVVKLVEKPRLVLKFVWLEKNIGLALDQVIPGHGTIPLSPYYFWPRKDAWEKLKTTLESKPWISQKRMIILLNQATDIINLWQQSGGNL